MDWPCHPPRSLYHQDPPALESRGKSEEGVEEMRRNAADGKTWSSIRVMVKDRQKWRDPVDALHATRRNGHE